MKEEQVMKATFLQKTRSGHSFLDSVLALLILSLLIVSVSSFLRSAGSFLSSGKERILLLLGENCINEKDSSSFN